MKRFLDWGILHAGRDLEPVTGVPPRKDMGPVEVLWDEDGAPPRCGWTNKSLHSPSLGCGRHTSRFPLCLVLGGVKPLVKWLIRNTSYISVSCTSLHPPDNGRLKFSRSSFADGRHWPGTVVTYECYRKYVGRLTRRCRSDGNWSGAPIRRCRRGDEI